MPWCPACDRYLTPPSVLADGSCPACGRAVDQGALATGPRVPVAAGQTPEAETLPPIPWHLKLVAGALAVYLGYRFFEMGEWLLRRL